MGTPSRNRRKPRGLRYPLKSQGFLAVARFGSIEQRVLRFPATGWPGPVGEPSIVLYDSVSNLFLGQCQRSPGIDSSPYEPSFHIVLHQPEIPPNTGAIGRTCLALHAKLWLVRPLGFRIDEKSLRRAGLDYWQHLNWQVVDDWDELQAAYADSPVTENRLWMFTRTAQRDFAQAEFRGGDWLVFGSETSGLPPSLLGDPGRNLRIPTFEQVRSLNLASAVAVAGYQAASQIRLFAEE